MKKSLFTAAEAKSKIGKRVIFNPAPEEASDFDLSAGESGTVTEIVEQLEGGYYLLVSFEELADLHPGYTCTKANLESGLFIETEELSA